MEKLPDEMICELVDAANKADLLSLAAASQKVNRIVHPFKTIWMMTQVFPLILKHLTVKDILNVKSTCKDWCCAVDTYMEKHPNLEPLDQLDRHLDSNNPSATDSPFAQTRNLLEEVRFLRTDQMREFINDFHGHIGSNRPPVPSRSLSFSPEWPMLENDEDHIVFFDTAVELLSTFGNGIWHVEINFHPGFRDPTRFNYDKLRRMLKYLPDLRSLEVFGWVFENEDEAFQMESEIIYVNSNPLPKLGSLVFLSVGVNLRITINRDDDWTPYVDISSPINQALLQTYGAQVMRLGIYSKAKQGSFTWPSSMSTQDSKLSEICLNLSLFDIKQLFAKINVNNMRKLALAQRVSLNNMIHIIQFFPKLEVIDVQSMLCSNTAIESDVSKYTFSTVQGFRVGFCHHVDFDFLLSFPNIGYLELICNPTLCVGPSSNLTPKDDFKIHMCLSFGLIYDSPIWRQFQNLKQITYRESKNYFGVNKSYSRRGWECKSNTIT